MRNYPGYPVDPPIRALQPRPYRRDELPQVPTSVANPGGYVSWVGQYTVPAGPFALYYPSGIVEWSDLQGKQYNVLEVDMECIATPSGWCVPDKIGIQTSTYGNSAGAYTYDSGQTAFTASWVFMPPKLAVTPVLGDPTTSYSLWGSRVAVLRGINPAFTGVQVKFWSTNDPTVYVGINQAQQPYVRLRMWYDPLISEFSAHFG